MCNTACGRTKYSVGTGKQLAFDQISMIMGLSTPGGQSSSNVSGCGWLKPDQTSSSQFDLVEVTSAFNLAPR